MYNNERGSGGDVYVVRLSAGCTGGVCSCRVANTCPVVLGSVVDLGDSSYVATYNATRIGKYMVHTSLAGIGRLSLTRTTTISSTNNAGPVILPLSTYNAQTASQVHVFSGFVRPHRAGSYTFSVTGSSGTSGYFSFTPQLNTATDAASTTYVFNTANSLYDISFQWTAAGALPSAMVLRWKYDGTPSNAFVDIPTDRFFSRMDVQPGAGSTCVQAGCSESYPVMTLFVEY